MKAAELRDLSAEDLRQRERELDDELFRLRLQHAMGQVEATQKLRATRRDRARVKTVLRELTRAQATKPQEAQA